MKRWWAALKRMADARREPRQTMDRGATLVVDGQARHVRLLDLSESGAMVSGPTLAAPGESVILQVLDRDPLRGQVRWSRDGRIGIGFTAPVNRDEDRNQR